MCRKYSKTHFGFRLFGLVLEDFKDFRCNSNATAAGGAAAPSPNTCPKQSTSDSTVAPATVPVWLLLWWPAHCPVVICRIFWFLSKKKRRGKGERTRKPSVRVTVSPSWLLGEEACVCLSVQIQTDSDAQPQPSSYHKHEVCGCAAVGERGSL